MSPELIRGLSLTQPWATLVAIGAKTIETRGWSTKYRGRIAIHAAKGFPKDCRALCYQPVFASALARTRADYPLDLPRGVILATATLLEVYLTGDAQNYRHITRSIAINGGRRWTFTPTEIAFGDYSPGRFMWLLDDVRPLTTPIPCKGALGLWTVPTTVIEGIASQDGRNRVA